MRLERPDRQWMGRIALILILLLAVALRLYRIDQQSLWNDEGTSVALAGRDLLAITRGAANDIHPPLYYYVLHVWIALLGSSELAVRSLSALLGTGVVWLTFALGLQFGPRRGKAPTPPWLGLTAALIAAVSPFQVYYSQETRMYMLSTFLGALSMWLFLRLLASRRGLAGLLASRRGLAGLLASRRGLAGLLAAWRANDAAGQAQAPQGRGWGALVAYAIVTTLLLYTHYFAATLLLAQNLAFLWWLARQRSFSHPPALRATPRWIMAQALIVGSYLPWLFVARRQLRSWPAISEPLRLAEWVPELLRVFGLGTLPTPLPDGTWVGFALLLLLGTLALCRFDALRAVQRSRNSVPCTTTMLYLLVPVVTMYVLSLTRPMYDPKFLLLSTPAFHLLIAQGVLCLAGAGRWPARPAAAPGEAPTQRRDARVLQASRLLAACAAMAFVGATSFVSLREYYLNPSLARDDYRGIARYIKALEGERDAILVNAPGQIETFTYYYQGDLPLYPLPRKRPLDKEQTEAELADMISGRRNIYAILWATDESDPERIVESWMDQHAYKAMDSWYGNVRLAVYAVPVEPSGAGIDNPLDVNLGNRIRLLGYNLPQSQVLPGDILQLALFWEATAPMTERYKVFTHVLDAHGHLVGQRDAEPGGGAKITTLWQEGEQVTDNYGLPILPGTPPGEYQIEIGMYGLSDGQRLPIIEGGEAVGDHVILQSVRVDPAPAPPPLSVLDMDTVLGLSFGDVTLLGQRWVKLGFEHQPETPLRAGDIAHLTLFWQADQPPGQDLIVRVTLQDQRGKAWLQHLAPVTSGQYPASSWRAEEIIRDQHIIVLPPDLSSGRYDLTLTLQGRHNNQPIGSPQTLRSVTISD